MTTPGGIPGRFRASVVLKVDHFSTIERGFWPSADGEVEAILRRLDRVPAWARPLARHLARREARALARLPGGIGPSLLAAERDFVVRGWISGLPLHLARPHGDVAFFRAAKTILREMRRAGVVHNDLAKEQNWLRDSEGRPRVTDFQLASIHPRGGPLFRLAAREDLRHLLKIKARYCPADMTPAERKVAASRSLPARIWRATGKRLYVFITRNVLNWMDREGAGDGEAARRAAENIGRLEGVGAAAVLAFQTGAGRGYYAFVESTETTPEAVLQAARAAGIVPDLVQIAARLPRNASGDPNEEILRLIAENQVELIGLLDLEPADRALADALVAERLNRSDRRLYRA